MAVAQDYKLVNIYSSLDTYCIANCNSGVVPCHLLLILVKNFTDFEGLSIGVPVREKNTWNTLTNNPYFALIILANLLLDKMGSGLQGYPPPSAATEHDN
jgi:hypothetical protein